MRRERLEIFANDGKVRAMARRKVPWVDLLLGSTAVAFAIESIPHPFCRDQALYFYIGREWFLRGKLPYRDTFDVKTPWIYALNGLSAWLFGDAMWGPRLFDAIALLALGAVCARLATPREEKLGEGTLGIALATSAIAYFGTFDFSCTAQCEVWSTLFSLACLLVCSHHRPRAATAIGAGLLAGLAVLAKPPSGLVCAIAAATLVVRVVQENPNDRARAARRSAALLAILGLAALVFPALFLGQIALKGGASAMYDVLVVNNRHYVVAGKWVHSTRQAIRLVRQGLHGFDPLFTVLWLGLAATLAREAKRRNYAEVFRRGVPLLLVVTTVISVWVQMKFCDYHWEPMIAPLTLAAVVLHRDLVRWANEQSWPPLRASWLAAALLFLVYYANAPIFDRWMRSTWATVARARGKISREAYLQAYSPPFYDANTSEKAGLWLRKYALPGDKVAVRGFEPQIYAISGLEAHGRFFWTTFLITPEWAYRMNEWREEDRRVFVESPPRWVLALDFVHEGVDSAEYFYPLGYKRITDIDHQYVVLEYCPDGRFPSILVRPKDDPGTLAP